MMRFSSSICSPIINRISCKGTFRGRRARSGSPGTTTLSITETQQQPVTQDQLGGLLSQRDIELNFLDPKA